MVENTNLVEAFMSKMAERNAMSIAANTKYSGYEAERKIRQKFGLQHTGWEGYTTIDGEKFRIYNANGTFYGKDSEGKYWNLDARKVEKEVPEMEDEWGYTPEGDRDWMGEHPTGRMTTKTVTEYQINTPLTDPEMLDFFKALDYVDSDDRAKQVKQIKADKKAASDKDTEQAKKIIKVEVINGKFTDPNDYVDDVDEEDWTHEDDEAEFNVKITIGSTPVFEGLALAGVNWTGSSRTTYYQPARMYMRNGDPGYPEESAGITTVNFDSVELAFFEDADGNQYEVSELAARIPEGKFRDMFVKYGEQIVEEALEGYVDSHSDDVEYEW